MRYNKPRRYKFRSNDKDFRRNDSQDLRISGINSDSNHFQRRSFSRNGLKVEKLLEKYNNLAKEALSNGDRILSESYYQHADHFLRVIGNRNSIQNNSKPHLDNSPIKENSDDKIILENKKNSSSQQPQNSEEI
jgi:hypothetical protein